MWCSSSLLVLHKAGLRYLCAHGANGQASLVLYCRNIEEVFLSKRCPHWSQAQCEELLNRHSEAYGRIISDMLMRLQSQMWIAVTIDFRQQDSSLSIHLLVNTQTKICIYRTMTGIEDCQVKWNKSDLERQVLHTISLYELSDCLTTIYNSNSAVFIALSGLLGHLLSHAHIYIEIHTYT